MVQIVRDEEPVGLGLLSLAGVVIERFNADYFAANQTSTLGSADLLVPDLAMAE